MNAPWIARSSDHTFLFSAWIQQCDVQGTAVFGYLSVNFVRRDLS